MKNKIVSVMVLVFTLCLNVVVMADSAAMALAAKAPADSLFLLSSSGYSNLEDEFNATLIAEIINDPQVKAFGESIKNVVAAQVGEVPEDAMVKVKSLRDAALAAGLHIDPKVCGVLFNSFNKEAEQLDGCIYMISEGGAERATAIKGFLNTLITTFEAGDDIKSSEFSSATLGQVTKYEVTEDEVNVSLNIAVKGKYVLAALLQDDFSQKYLDTLAACCDSKESKFGDFDDLTSKGDDIVAMFNMPAYVKAITDMMVATGEQEVEKIKGIFKSTQLDSFGKVYYRLGFKGKQLVFDTIATQPAMYNEIAKPINLDLLRAVPADATYVATMNYDMPKVIEMYKNMFNEMMTTEEYNQISGMISGFETDNAIALKEGVFNNFTGEVVASFKVNSMTGLLNSTGFIILTVKDSDLLIGEVSKLAALGLNMADGMVPVTYDQVEVEGVKVNTLNIPQLMPFGVQPTITALDKTHVILGLTQATATSTVKLYAAGSKEGTILSNAKFNTALASTSANKVMLQYTDSEAMLKAIGATGNTYWPMLSMLASGQGINLPPTLPQLNSKFDNLPPSVTWATITEDGKARTHIETDGVGYAAVGGAYVGAVSVAIAAPAMSRGSMYARSAQAINELKEIAVSLAMYSADNGGKLPEKLEEISKYLGEGEQITVEDCAPLTYRGMGMNSSLSPELITVYTNNGEVYLVGFLDGRVERVDFYDFADKIESDNELRKVSGLAEIAIPEEDAEIVESADDFDDDCDDDDDDDDYDDDDDFDDDDELETEF